MGRIPEGHMWQDETGAVYTMHRWHRWFAWRPVFVPDAGWKWLVFLDRRFSIRSSPVRRSAVVEYRLPAAQRASKEGREDG